MVVGTYVDFNETFDLVYREPLWEFLQLLRVPTEILRLICALYTVQWDNDTSGLFPVTIGVR